MRLTVEDRGEGFAPDVLARAFEPYVTTKTKGTGLGLAIGRTVVRAHGGRLWYSPVEGGGARFHFTLPSSPAASGETP